MTNLYVEIKANGAITPHVANKVLHFAIVIAFLCVSSRTGWNVSTFINRFCKNP